MLAEKAFRYHRENNDLFNLFDRGLKGWQYVLLCAFFFVTAVTGIAWITRLFVCRLIKAKVFKGEAIVGVLFSSNQRVINSAVKGMGISFPVYDFSGTGENSQDSAVFQTRFIFCAAMANAWVTYKELFAARNDDLLYNNTVRVVKLSGEALIFPLLLNGIRVLVKYNDHGADAVLLYDMAHEKGIRTVYMQHAPVSERFPPLHHDLNVLFSQDSVDKYKFEHGDARVFILFDVRFAAGIKNKSFEQKDQIVLLCTNHMDDMQTVKSLAADLNRNYKVIIRPHPAEKRDWHGDENYKVSENASIWKDLENARYVLTNESAVVLEAIYGECLCYKCAFFSPSFDNYGFLRQGLLLKEYETKSALIADMNNNVVTYNIEKLTHFIGEVDMKESRIKNLHHEILHLRDQVPGQQCAVTSK